MKESLQTYLSLMRRITTNGASNWSYQDVLEVIKNMVNPLVQGATNAQQAMHKEEKKKDFKVLFFIHQCVDGDNFENVGDCESSKQVWDILEKAYTWVDKAKVMRWETHNCKLELI